MKVEYKDHLGTDLTVANAARVSFSKHRAEFTESDKKLIEFLARGCTLGDWTTNVDALVAYGSYQSDGEGWEDWIPEIESILKDVRSMPTHWTPFGHCSITLHIKAPIFVARQLFKHTVGSVKNEVSRRYVTEGPEFWVPDVLRQASKDKKQGSGGPVDDPTGDLTESMRDVYDVALSNYRYLIRSGVCPEQARAVLPQGMYTEWWDTGSLYYWSQVYNSRIRKDAQKETQEIAKMIGEIIEPLYPVSWKALTQ